MNGPSRDRVVGFLGANTRMVAWAIALVLLVDVGVALRHGVSPTPRGKADQAASTGDAGAGGTSGALPSSGPSAAPTIGATPGSLPSAGKTLEGKPGTKTAFGTIPFGVTKDTIEVVYYWAGDRTMGSGFLGPTGQRGQLDEADAFRNFVAYVNKHANGDATLMGFPFNLHGRKLHPKIYDTGKAPEVYGSTADLIIQHPPFVAISSHGGVSDYMCDYLYKHRIFNISTYDMGRYYPSGLYAGTNRYCMPQGLAWENQVDLSVAFLKHQATTKYQGTSAQKRVYGLVFADYPGLAESVNRLIVKLANVGIKVVATYKLPTSLTDAGQEAPAAVAKMKGKGVNTMIMPDGGAPITFTHAAQARGFNPDYYVWPCSGQDAAGQVRLFDPKQWARADGLSCYDRNFNLDLTLDSNARQTQWYKQYQEMAGQKDPPSTSPLVYQSFLPMLAGITNAGRELTVERFRAGMEAFRYPHNYIRYDAVHGPTASLSHFWVNAGSDNAEQIGDVAYVKWSTTEHTPGNATTGNYIYSDKRYRPGAVF